MTYPWLYEYCSLKPGAVCNYNSSWRATRWFIEKKLFAVRLMSSYAREVINLKIEPSYANLLQQEHPDVIPAYHMNKLHWCSVFLDGNVPDRLVKEMIDESYGIVLSGLSKKLQQKISVRAIKK